MATLSSIDPAERIEPLITALTLRRVVETGQLPDGTMLSEPSKYKLLREIDSLIDNYREARSAEQKLPSMTRLFQLIGNAGFFGPKAK